ncbi:MAG: glycosyltransferase family 1 protein [Anaerolineales bacterium]|nr:glycosyltransferase family 1 protein [Anaerolineales bacterium]
MNITLLTYGSRGDVEPFLALANGLTNSGWQVHLAAPAVFLPLLNNPQVRYTGFPGEPSEIVQRLNQTSSWNLVRTVGGMMGFVLPIAAEVLEKARLACSDADVIVHTFLLTQAGYELARERSIPNLSALFFPVFAPTKAFPSPNMPDLPWGLYRRATHSFTTSVFWQGSRITYNRMRRDYPHFPALSGWPFHRSCPDPPPILFAFSPQVVPRPTDWGPNNHVTGYWTDPEPPEWSPPRDLLNFLTNGPPPVCLGTGSSSDRAAEKLAASFIDACRHSGQRGVVVGNQSVLLPDNVFLIKDAPYSWLFPRCSSVIHHGGAGTTAAGLRAGVPNIILPISSDQPFWAARVFALGVGPAPIPARKVNSTNLTAAMKAALESATMRQQAAKLGQSLQAENGVQRAIDWIESTLFQGS